MENDPGAIGFEMKLVLEDMPLKSFLTLFDPDENIQVMVLGDTWHSSGGFADESILIPAEKVRQILEFKYDFRGLVVFKAAIGAIDVNYREGVFEVSGDKTGIEKLVNKIKTNNANPESPHKYAIKFMRNVI